MEGTLTFGWGPGPGPGPRLLAPGRPDWIGTDGVVLGWAVRDRLFLDRTGGGAEVLMVELPDLVEEVVAMPGRWVVALGQGFVSLDPATGELLSVALDEDADPVTTRPGVDCGLYVEVPEHRCVRLGDGRVVPLPAGATGARWIAPFLRGVGVAWISLGTLFRLGDRAAALGKVPGATGLAVGPLGAVVCAAGKSTHVAAPRGLPTAVEVEVDATTARFSVDGAVAWAATPTGAVELDLAGGRVTRTLTGSLLPLGPGPLFLDAERGSVVDADGTVRREGFGGALPGRAGHVLVGPGGRIWNLRGPASREGGLHDGIAVTDGAQVLHVRGDEVRILGGGSFVHGIATDEDEVVLAELLGGDEGARLVLTTADGERGTFALPDGARLDRRHVRPPPGPRPDVPRGVEVSGEGEDSQVQVGEARWPVPADGVVRVGEGLFAWTRDGMLLQLEGPSA